MNLLEIILQYLNTPEKDRAEFLKDLVTDCGMPRFLIKHIEGCATACKVQHQGTFQLNQGETDVNIWTVKCFFGDSVPEMGYIEKSATAKVNMDPSIVYES